jgi:WD40 repeat protein/serine/threonine protein kinase
MTMLRRLGARMHRRVRLLGRRGQRRRMAARRTASATARPLPTRTETQADDETLPAHEGKNGGWLRRDNAGAAAGLRGDAPAQVSDGTPEDPPGDPTGDPAEDSTVAARPMLAPAAPPAGAPPGARDTHAPGDRIDQYEIIRPLGRGGMGMVHLARDLRLGRLVAIKFLARRGRRMSEHFLAEARATARCNHENIVVIHDVGEHRGRPYMVLEHVEGQTLRAWLDERGCLDATLAGASAARAPLPPGLAVDLMIPVVRALACAHEMGIVHRDLKPANIMITHAGAIKVVDFGIAKLMEQAQGGEHGWQSPSDAGMLLGTPPYMSPEQLARDAVDHRADIWAVGIMLFEMVTGTHPVLSADAGTDIQNFRRYVSEITNPDLPLPSARERGLDLGPLSGIIDRCLIKDRMHRTASARVLLQELESLAGGRTLIARSEHDSPFAGLVPFQEADADRFFGRTREIAGLVARLRSQPLVTVAGPSGAGKSSLVRAGVIPALERSGEGWTALVTRPGRRPLAALAEVLASLPQDTSAASARDPDAVGLADPAALADRLRAEPGSLGRALRAWARARLRRPVLVIDQLEELYTLGASAAERAAFLACLDAVADDAASPLRVLLAVRADFLDRLTENGPFLDNVNRGLMFLSPLERDGLREALTRPVAAREHRFERPDMVERILDELTPTRGALPLLQFTAAALWDRRDRARRLLTEASLHALGGVAGALASHADAILAAMPGREARLARSVFLRLVTPERTRALATLGELRQCSHDRAAMDRMLNQLIDGRLLAVEGSTRDNAGGDQDDAVVEIVHESLIGAWPLLARWLSENEEDVLFLARLRGAAADWERSGRDVGLLWTGQAASDARAWRGRYQGELAAPEERFLDAVLAALDRRSRLRRRLLGAAFAITIAIALALGWLAWQQARASRAAVIAAAQAEQQAMRARDATRMAAVRALPGDPTTQLALLREIENTTAPPPGAIDEAKRLLLAPVAEAVLIGHEYDVTSAVFSPDGGRIASASRDRTVRLWNADGSGAPITLGEHEQGVLSVAFSPDGTSVASASYDGTVRVWRAAGAGAGAGTGASAVLSGHDDWVWSVAFSPDGARIASASYDRTVRVWNADGTGTPLVLRGHEAAVMSVAFSPDGARIASASKDGTVRVWSADGSGQPLVLRGHDDWVTSAAFSPDGGRIVSASNDDTVRVWSADGGGEPLVLRGHAGDIASARFSPDGARIVSASRDRTVRIWPADGAGEPHELRGHEDQVTSAAFSPDGSRIVSASQDETIRVWNTALDQDPLVLHGHQEWATSAAFSPDGTRIASGSADKTVRVWDTGGRGERRVLLGHEAEVKSVAFSRDGARIVSASRDRTVRVWNTDGTGTPLVLRGHTADVWSAAFSPDGARVASASFDRTVRVWNADGTGTPLVLQGHDDAVLSVAFSPDGTRIVSASNDETVRVWNADGTGVPLVLHGHTADVWSAMFSPDGARIVSASADKTVRVWNADGSGVPVVLRGRQSFQWAEYSPDGTHLVTVSKDEAIRIWPADGTGEPVVLTGHTQAISTARFSPDSTRIVTASADGTVRVWRDLAPVSLDDPRLWTRTRYCVPVEARQALLGVPAELAHRGYQRCLDRVARPDR